MIQFKKVNCSRLTIAILMVGIFGFASGQDSTNIREYLIQNLRYSRYVGFDMNGMMSQVVPFNTIIPTGASPAIVSRRMWNNKGIRTTFGATYDFDLEQLETTYFSFGYTSKSQISGNFYWLKGVDLKFMLEEIDNNSFFSSLQGFFGVSPYWGVEYQLNRVVSFSTETSLDLGVSLDGFPAIQMRPPLHLQAHFNITK